MSEKPHEMLAAHWVELDVPGVSDNISVQIEAYPLPGETIRFMDYETRAATQMQTKKFHKIWTALVTNSLNPSMGRRMLEEPLTAFNAVNRNRPEVRF